MPMRAYPVFCYAAGCGQRAEYKVAACWSDGSTRELKTYALSCPDCLSDLFAAAELKRSQCKLATGETLEAPGIYALHRGDRDRTLKRCLELEASLKADVTS